MTVGFGSSSTAELQDHLGVAGAVPQKKVTFRNTSTKSMSVRSASSAQSQLHLFLNCRELIFVANDISTYKQFITILNPYNFDIHFRTYCTNPNRYELSPVSGKVPAMTSIDLTVRLKDASNPGTEDRLKFRITELANRDNVMGERDLRVFLSADNPAPSEKSTRESFRPHKPSAIRRTVDIDESNDAEPKPNIFIIIIGMVCLLSLCLPTEGETPESWVAQYVRLTVNQKLIAAFVLGMVTMVVFRTR